MPFFPEKGSKPAMVSFRCPPGLRDEINALHQQTGYKQNEVIITLLRNGIDLQQALRELTPAIDEYARSQGFTFTGAIAHLVQVGLERSKR